MPGRRWQTSRKLEKNGQLAGYHYLPAMKADLLRRLGRTDEASLAYRRVLELTRNEAERQFLAERLANLTGPGALRGRDLRTGAKGFTA